MSAIFNDPPLFGGLCNPDIQANKNTPLDLGQGSAPPGDVARNIPLMVLVNSDTTGIQVSLDTTNITGTRPIDYYCAVRRKDGTGNMIDTTAYPGVVYIFQAINLDPGTIYEFQIVTTNPVGHSVGPSQEFSTTPAPPGTPGNLPALEQSIGSFPNTITLYFSSAGVTGTQPITYTCNYGLQTQGPINDVPVIMSSPDNYGFTLVGLPINTPYVFQLTATNSIGATRGIIQTFEVDTTPLPPSGPPSIPISLGTTTASVTVSFDVDGITGSGSLVFSALYGTVAQGAINPVEAVLVQDTLYMATAINLLPNTAYVFKSVVTSSAGTQSSALSEPFTTLS